MLGYRIVDQLLMTALESLSYEHGPIADLRQEALALNFYCATFTSGAVIIFDKTSDKQLRLSGCFDMIKAGFVQPDDTSQYETKPQFKCNTCQDTGQFCDMPCWWCGQK